MSQPTTKDLQNVKRNYINLYALLIVITLATLGVACIEKTKKQEIPEAPGTYIDITPLIDSLLYIENIDEVKKIIGQQIDTTSLLPDTILYSYFFNMGKVLQPIKDKSDSALLCLNRAKKIAESISRYDLIIDANNWLVRKHSKLMQLEKSMEISLESIKLANTYHPEKLSSVYEEQARIYFYLNEANDKALDCLKKALTLSEIENDTASYARLCFKISTVLQSSSKLDSAEIYLNKALDYFELVDAPDLANAYIIMGSIYSERGKLKKSISYYLKSLKTSEEHNQTLYAKCLASASYNLGLVYERMDKSDTAIYYFNRALNYYRDNKRDSNKKLIYRRLAQNYDNIGNYKLAMENFDHYIVICEKEFEENLELSINDLEEKYKSKEKERKIEELKKEMAFDNKVKLQQKIIIIILIAFFISTVLGVLFYFKQKISKEKQEQVLLEQRLLRSQMNPHFILNTFTAIQYLITNNENKQANKYLIKFSRLLRLSLDNSISSFVAVQDEIEAIQHYLELQIMRYDRSFNYNLKVYDDFKNDFIFIPPMLIQPFVENSIEHGFKGLDKSGKINITINKKDKYIECLIEDNGKGLTSNTENHYEQRKKSLSTKITSKRLKFLSRRLKMEASIEILNKDTKSEESGLIVKLRMPYKTDNYA